MPQDTADDSWQTLKSFLIIYQVCFNTVFLNIRSFIIQFLYKDFNYTELQFYWNINAKNPFLSAVQANLYLKMFDYMEIWQNPQSEKLQSWA